MSFSEGRKDFKGWTSMNYGAGYQFSSCVKSLLMLPDLLGKADLVCLLNISRSH